MHCASTRVNLTFAVHQVHQVHHFPSNDNVLCFESFYPFLFSLIHYLFLLDALDALDALLHWKMAVHQRNLMHFSDHLMHC